MATRYWVGGTGTWNAVSTANWSASSGGAPGATAPVAIDNVIFDANSGTGTCTTAAGATCTAVTFNTASVTLSLGANLTALGTFTFTQGNISLNTFVLGCNTFSNSNSNTRSINFGASGSMSLNATSGTLWSGSTSTGFTTTGTSKTVNAPNGGAGTRTFNFGASLAEADVMNLNVTGGTDTLSLQGNYKSLNLTGFAGTVSNVARSIFGSLTLPLAATYSAGTGTTTFRATSGTHTITTNGASLDFPLAFNGSGGTFEFANALTQGSTRAFTITAGTVRLKNGATSTVGSFATSGAEQKYLRSTVDGSQATLTQASGVVSVSYLTIQDIKAIGGATWNAFVNRQNVDDGNNDGWNFLSIVSTVFGGVFKFIFKPVIQ